DVPRAEKLQPPHANQVGCHDRYRRKPSQRVHQAGTPSPSAFQEPVDGLVEWTAEQGLDRQAVLLREPDDGTALVVGLVSQRSIADLVEVIRKSSRFEYEGNADGCYPEAEVGVFPAVLPEAGIEAADLL